MENLVITYETILAVCASTAVIGGAVTVLTKLCGPYRAIKKQVGEHSQRLTEGDRRFTRLENDSKMEMQTLLVMLDHMATGNSIENLKKQRENLQKYMTER